MSRKILSRQNSDNSLKNKVSYGLDLDVLKVKIFNFNKLIYTCVSIFRAGVKRGSKWNSVKKEPNRR